MTSNQRTTRELLEAARDALRNAGIVTRGMVASWIDQALLLPDETIAEPLCDGEVRVINHSNGEPTGVRDDAGFICHFHHVTNWSGQEDRYRKELALRARQAEAIANALRSAVEPSDA